MLSPSDCKTKAIAMAVGASIIAAVATMLVPTSILEAITGSTGLSELVPATGAPLGDKARALIAFTAGAVTMILVLATLMRRPNEEQKVSVPEAPPAQNQSSNGQKGETNMIAILKERIGNIALPKMPWSRDNKSGDVFELSDLPKLRAQDAHPDYPARKLISATTDLGATNIYGQCAPLPAVSETAKMPEQTSAHAGANSGKPEIENAFEQDILPTAIDFESSNTEFETPEAAIVEQEQVAPPHSAYAAAEVPQPNGENLGLADLVSRFENAVNNRTQRFAGVEAALSAAQQPAAELPAAQPAQPAPPRPPLEAVPGSRKNIDDDDMDAALNAALATLQRMNSK